ncbi:MAG: gephyrin-like molybdotransferase Glp [Solirubrobacteraceae bacterium]
MASEAISIIEARNRVLQASKPLGHETVAVEQALDRVLAQDVRAAGDVPPFASSAMDGYALKAGPAGRRLRVIGESRAGAPAADTLESDEAIRISTGAAVPPDADAVIRQEDVDTVPRQRGTTTTTPHADTTTTTPHDDIAAGIRGRDVDIAKQVIVTKVALATGENVRGAGEDMRAGSLVLRAGITVRAAELGAAVAGGVGELVVARRPTVAVLATGDELRAPGEPLGPGQIHNSNAPMLAALAIHSGAVVLPAQRLADDRAATEASLAAALEQAEVVIVSGGVSVGPHDHVKPALANLGVREHFWRVALQPGGPTWFGERDGRLVFGLPGNPVSAFVTFSLFAVPALAAMQGATADEMPASEAILGVAVARNRTREQALRVRLERRGATIVAFPNGPQGSHILTSLVGADALALIAPGPDEAPAGITVALEYLPR